MDVTLPSDTDAATAPLAAPAVVRHDAAMDRSTELALLDRIQAHRTAGRATDEADAAMQLPTAAYTDLDRFAAERDLLHRQPVIAGLSGLLPGPNTWATVDVGNRSVVVTRNGDGQVAAMLNVCRHRGAEVASGCGAGPTLMCPYHGWTYHLDGRSAARRRSEYFVDVAPADLTRLPCVEQDGLIWVSADPDATIPDHPLAGAEAELAPYGLADYRLFASTEFTRPINWKLAVDTFCEAYHLSILHRDSLAPMIYDDYSLFDRFGAHGRMVSTRKSVVELDDLGRDDWSLAPHATILWFLVPNTVLIHQQDHMQLYQSRPGASPDEAHLTVSLYVPQDSPRSERHWERNFELLVRVTDTEDFATAAGIQRGYHSGAQDVVTFGRNEPALQHYHRSLLELLG